MTDDTAERWQTHARWQLGRISDTEYADWLEEHGEPDDPVLDILLTELRNRNGPRVEGPNAAG